MDRCELEAIADVAYAWAHVDLMHPSVIAVARALLGPHAVIRGLRPRHASACLTRVRDNWRIVVSRSLPRAYALFFVGHELAHWLMDLCGVKNDDNEEAAADYLAAALLAPRETFRAALRELGEDLPALANVFHVTETCAALRLGEVTGQPLAVVTPHRVHVRGPEEWVWPDEMTLRAWTRKTPPGVRSTRLTDDPRRVVLGVEQ